MRRLLWYCGGTLALASACTATIGGDEVEGEDSDQSSASSAGFGGSGPIGGMSGTGADPGGNGGGAPVDINNGWIGGPCASDADCGYEGGFCLTDAEGFPQGMCGLDCSQFCPDEDGQVSTFCVAPSRLGVAEAPEGLCTTRCDYGQSPSGCRAGYQCNVVDRYGDPDTEVFACVPGDDNPYPLSECHLELLERGVAFTPAVSPNDSPEGQPNVVCTIEEPIYVSPHLAGVAFHPASLQNDPKAIFTRCRHALAMLDTAEVLSADGVDALVHYGVYNCRTIANSSKLSEHARANAIDIAGVRRQGEYWSILGEWEVGVSSPVTESGQFLRAFADTLYDEVIYNIILTPEYDAAHADHLHCDLTEGAHFIE